LFLVSPSTANRIAPASAREAFPTPSAAAAACCAARARCAGAGSATGLPGCSRHHTPPS